MQALGGHYGYKTDHAGEEDTDIGKRVEQGRCGIQDGKGRGNGTSSRVGVAAPPRLYPRRRRGRGAETVIFQKIR